MTESTLLELPRPQREARPPRIIQLVVQRKVVKPPRDPTLPALPRKVVNLPRTIPPARPRPDYSIGTAETTTDYNTGTMGSYTTGTIESTEGTTGSYTTGTDKPCDETDASTKDTKAPTASSYPIGETSEAPPETDLSCDEKFIQPPADTTETPAYTTKPPSEEETTYAPVEETTAAPTTFPTEGPTDAPAQETA